MWPTTTAAGAQPVTLDRLIALLLFGVVVGYLASLPRNLGSADESFFLYEARRIREGEVMYRDFFEFVAPGAWYLMAALYGLFGTDMATARIGAAAIHGLIVILSYLTCRRLGVRRELSVIVPLAYVALCQPPWPHASPHWFGTLLVAVLLYAMVKPANVPTPSRARCVTLGVVVGALITVEQQKGAVMAAGAAAFLVMDYLTSRWYGPASLRQLLTSLLSFGGGVAIIAVPVMLAMIAAAGWRPVFDDLVVYPLYSYHRFAAHSSWGAVGVFSRGYAAYTWPTVLKWLPIAMVPPLLRAAILVVRREDRDHVRQLTALVVVGVLSTVSILYNPDFIHIAFVAPVLLVAAAEGCDWVLSWIPFAVLSRAAGWVVALALAGFLLRQASDNTARSHREYPRAHETAFGRVDFAAAWEPALVDTVRTLLGQAGSNELFCYPLLASPYLTTGARNPTPFHVLTAQQSPPGHLQQALSILKNRPPPYIIAAPLFLRPDDPIAQLIDERYAFFALPGFSIFEPGVALFQRKDLVAAGGPP